MHGSKRDRLRWRTRDPTTDRDDLENNCGSWDQRSDNRRLAGKPGPHLRQRSWEGRVPAQCQMRRLHKEACIRIDGVSSLCRLCGSQREACKTPHSRFAPRQRIQMSVVFYAVRCWTSPGTRVPGAPTNTDGVKTPYSLPTRLSPNEKMNVKRNQLKRLNVYAQ